MGACLEKLPFELIQMTVYELGVLSPADVSALCQTCKYLNFAIHGDGNAFDLAQHQSLFGLQTCIKNSWSRAAILILKRETFDENENLTDCLKTACSLGLTKVFAKLITFPQVSLSQSSDGPDNWEAIYMACQLGHLDIVKILIKDPRIDISADGNYALHCACEFGQVHVVEYLLRHPDVDPTDEDGCPLSSSIATNQKEVVKILLEDGRVDPSLEDYCVIKFALLLRRYKIANILLNHPGVVPDGHDLKTLCARLEREKATCLD